MSKQDMQSTLLLLYKLVFGSVYFIFAAIGRVTKSEELMVGMIRISEGIIKRKDSLASFAESKLEVSVHIDTQTRISKDDIRIFYEDEMGQALDLVKHGLAGLWFNLVALVHIAVQFIKQKMQK